MFLIYLTLVLCTVLVHLKPINGEQFVNECNRSIWLSKSTPWKNISSTTAFPSKVSLKYSWCVSVANGYRIRVHFQLFNLKNSTNCSSSAVELVEHDGYSFGSLGRYCGHHMPDDVVSRLRYVTVIYTITNGTVALHPGFQASLSLELAETCSKYHDPEANYNIMLSGSSGRFQSPFFPLDYHINMKCRWIITVPSGHRIKISFQAFYLGSKRLGNCDKVDHVEVRDSFIENDPGYGIFCGNVAPPPIYSVGPKILVTFISDEERVFPGFAARFDAISNGVCTTNNSVVSLNLTHDSTGRLASPDYPLQFPPIGSCYWRLKAPDGYRVKLQFTKLNIQGDCKHGINGGNWVRVDDSFVADFDSVSSYWGRFCSPVQPPVIYSTRNQLQVFFTTNYTSSSEYTKGDNLLPSPNTTGFYASYEVIPQGYTSRCRTDTKPQKPIEVRGYTGSLVSPGYPYSYPIITCTWKIVVPDGYIVEVKIDDFDMACSGGSKLQVGKDTFCGSNKPSGLLTSESDLMIQMIITEAQDNRGFRATFTMTERELAVASIVPWIVIPIVLVAIGVTVFVTWRRNKRARERGSSFKTSIINRMRTQSTGGNGQKNSL